MRNSFLDSIIQHRQPLISPQQPEIFQVPPDKTGNLQRVTSPPRRLLQHRQLWLLLFSLCWISPGPVAAQPLPVPLDAASELGLEPRDSPGDPLDFGTRSGPALTLPPLPARPDNEKNISALSRIFIRKVRIINNTVFPGKELARITAPYENRQVSAEELQALRHALTLHYVNHGYINSGAILADQKVEDGVVTYTIIEGILSDIEVTGLKRLRPGYVSSRISLAAGPPLNINTLQERFQLISRDPLIRRVNAALSPGEKPGQAMLKVEAEEARPYDLTVQANNQRSPSVGGEQLQIKAIHRNITGWGDSLSVQYGLTRGLDDLSVSYARPLNRYDTTLKLRYSQSSSDVVEQPFAAIDIESRSTSCGISLSQPLFISPRTSWLLGLDLEYRTSRTYLLGRPFSFSPGVVNGESKVTVFRISQDWVHRSAKQIIAFRARASRGIDALGSTIHSGTTPDSDFFVLLGQFQWARRFEEISDSQLIFRTDIQWSRDPLLPLEKFAVGGMNSVRGYRENHMVRDCGIVSSLEYRLPLFNMPLPRLSKQPEDSMVQLALFYDWGRSTNVSPLPSPKPDTISSVGLGLRWDVAARVQARVYWGIPLQEVNSPHNNLQDRGIHFQFSYQLF